MNEAIRALFEQDAVSPIPKKRTISEETRRKLSEAARKPRKRRSAVAVLLFLRHCHAKHKYASVKNIRERKNVFVQQTPLLSMLALKLIA